ncbi:hypothetical protein [Porcipelethomonas sp.]|uniref:hypothetical protein n=1 Tax=Porcipelethomonas sp. TaxID=2981675 RepID=UPI003EF77B6D
MSIYAEFRDSSGKLYAFTQCISFFFSKEAYTPYTYFEGIFATVPIDAGEVNRVYFYINNKNIHLGLVDSIDFYRKNNTDYMKIKSKGFTSLLCQNQPEPGMNTNVTLSDIMSGFSIPYATYETTEAINYIYVKEGSTLWDAAANLNFRLNGGYPYIEGTNHVRVTLKDPAEISVNSKDVIKSGVLYDYMKIVSHLHMKDAEGTYNVFSRSSQYAIDRNLIRHKQIPLDMQYLSDPDSGLLFKLNYSMRGCRCRYVQYAGYAGEDLNDTLTYEDGSISAQRIKRIEISGQNGIVKTLLGVYEDAF